MRILARKIRRTIKTAIVEYEKINLQTKELITSTELLTGSITNWDKMLRQLKCKFNNETMRVLQIINVDYQTKKYEMLESDFIKNAVEVNEPKRS